MFKLTKTYLFIFMVASVAFLQQLESLQFSVKDLGTLKSEQSTASSINNQGVIAGRVWQGSKTSDFIWHPEKGPTIFSVTPSQNHPIINELNQIASVFWYSTHNWFYENTHTKRIYTMDANNTFTDLGVPKTWKVQTLEKWQIPSYWDDHRLSVIAFNDSGEILVTHSKDPNNETKIAVWKNGSFVCIDSKLLAEAYTMDNRGRIVGKRWENESQAQTPWATIYDTTTHTTQDLFKKNGTVLKINDLGQIIGRRQNFLTMKSEGYLWDPSLGIISLGEFLPTAINNNQQIIGYINEEVDHMIPFLWQNGSLINLNEALKLDPSSQGWLGVVVLNDINDQGQIVGAGSFDSQLHAILLNLVKD